MKRVLGPLLLVLAACGPTGPELDPWTLEWRALQSTGGRPTEATADLPRYAPEDALDSVVSPGGAFRVHFSRRGPNAVRAADVDGSGVPDFVELVAREYDAVAAFYAGLGYRRPPEDSGGTGDIGGDGRFDVYLVDFAGRADGAFRGEGCRTEGVECHGYMLQENDFAGYAYRSLEEAVAILASHEFFHAVQAAYRPGLGSVASEGTAVWASERFRPELDDLERFSASYLSRPDRPLTIDPDGPAQSFSYGASLFFQFLGERLGDGVIRALWEESVRAPTARWPELLDTVLRRDAGMDFDTAFTEFTLWNLATGPRTGAGKGYARGAGYASLVTAARTLPVDESRVRVAAAAIRAFDVEGGGEVVSVAFQPEAGTETPALHLWAAAVTANEVLRVVRVDGPGPLTVQVPARDATRVVVAVVDGRQQGDGRYGRLCITGTSTDAPCPRASEDPDEEPRGGCQAAPASPPWALLLLLCVTRARRPSG